jgi:hypothetical protein
MRIEITGEKDTPVFVGQPTSTTVVLMTGSADGQPLNDLRQITQRTVDVALPVRGINATLFDRGGRIRRLTFTGYVLQSSIGAAEAFVLKHEATLPSKVSVKFTTQGPTSFVLTIPSAVVESVETWHVGRTTFATYTIVFGKIS